MLGNVLFINPSEVLSDGTMDLSYFFVDWRYFGFHELRSGHLPLWNPHIYCGAPFFGNCQSAMLYPPNVLYLVMPLAMAINWSIALNVLLGGVFTFYWLRHRRLHSLACFLAAVMFMFCGPHFLQIHAGHLPNLCTLIWAPLLFLAIDKIIDRPALGPCLLGMFATAMAVFAGHPQYVFYLGVAAGVYAALNLAGAPQRGKVAAGLAAIAIGGIALSAIQLFTGMDESGESMRSAGMTYDFAASFSFPPENLLTLVAPWCLGDAKNDAYCGRWFITEVSLFVSVMGLVLAVYGMVRGERATRRFSTVMILVTLVLAMGKYTPLFPLLFKYAPGFNLFRGMDKFIWLTALFLSMLAGIGLDRVLRNSERPWWLIGGAAMSGIALCGLAVLAGDPEWWAKVMSKLRPSEAPYMTAAIHNAPDYLPRTSTRFVSSIIEGAACLFCAAGILALVKSHRRIACIGIVVMTAIELAVFSQSSLMTFEIQAPYPTFIRELLAKDPGDYRVRGENANSAMRAGTLDMGGEDPSALLRYERYMRFAYGLNPDSNDEEPTHSIDLRTFRMLRVRYLLSESKNTYQRVFGELPRLSLIDRFRIITNYHEMFSVLGTTNFPVSEEVILESQPEPAPQLAREKGSVKLLESSSDSLTVEADTASPNLLFITDAYSKNWRALALPDSSQKTYSVMPANYCLQAVPLAAGHHVLRLEYSPPSFRVGRIVSIIAWITFLPLAGLAWRRSKIPVQAEA